MQASWFARYSEVNCWFAKEHSFLNGARQEPKLLNQSTQNAVTVSYPGSHGGNDDLRVVPAEISFLDDNGRGLRNAVDNLFLLFLHKSDGCYINIT